VPTVVVTEQVLHSFSQSLVPVVGQSTKEPDGTQPEGDVTLSSNGQVIYGRTFSGGQFSNTQNPQGLGVIFSMNSDGSNYQLLHSFGGTVTYNGQQVPDGNMPRHNAMALSSDGSTLYSMALEGGTGTTTSGGDGIIFSYNVNTNTYTLLYPWQGGNDGSTPHGSVIFNDKGDKIYGMTEQGGGSANKGTLFEMSLNSSTPTPKILFSFNGTQGEEPHGTPILANDNLYGLTRKGGTMGDGVLFDYNLDTGQMTTLYSFSGSPLDGATPFHGIPQFDNNVLYGMTTDGGANGGASGDGMIFAYSLDPNAQARYQVLHNFGDPQVPNDGTNPDGSVTIVNNVIYGVTTGGGSSGHGTFFSMNLDGSGYQVLYSFQGAPDGDHPIDSLTPVVQPDGSIKFYGMSQKGGTKDLGSVFEITVSQQNTVSQAPTVINLNQVQVTPGLNGQTATLTAQVSSPSGPVNAGTLSFSMAGQTVSATVNGNGQATAAVQVPAFTTSQPLIIGLGYSDKGGVFAASSSSATVSFNLLEGLLPSTTSFNPSGGQTITDTLFGLPALERFYNALGQLTSVDLLGFPVVMLNYNSQGQLTSLIGPGFVDVFLYSPQGQLLAVI
jgi:uncharacterized repeat protein (TIGR03803 family)